MLFQRPKTALLTAERRPVEGASCPECSSPDIKEYTVLRVSGWKRVQRCQSCLRVLEATDPPTPLGFTYTPYSVYLRKGHHRPGDPGKV